MRPRVRSGRTTHLSAVRSLLGFVADDREELAKRQRGGSRPAEHPPALPRCVSPWVPGLEPRESASRSPSLPRLATSCPGKPGLATPCHHLAPAQGAAASNRGACRLPCLNPPPRPPRLAVPRPPSLAVPQAGLFCLMVFCSTHPGFQRVYSRHELGDLTTTHSNDQLAASWHPRITYCYLPGRDLRSDNGAILGIVTI
jgi:hypothetical protein